MTGKTKLSIAILSFSTLLTSGLFSKHESTEGLCSTSCSHSTDLLPSENSVQQDRKERQLGRRASFYNRIIKSPSLAKLFAKTIDGLGAVTACLLFFHCK